MNRNDFQQIAQVRIDEARILLDKGKFDGAYYLAGYAVECALKACIAKLTREYDFPREQKFVQKCYTHEIETLIKSAGLELQRDSDAKADPALSSNWGIVKDWDESSRYERHDEPKARLLYEAITDPVHGVLPWIQRHW